MTLLSGLLVFSFLSITYGTLVQIQVIHRHGARSVIDKHHFDPRIERENPTLYPAGVRQLETLGRFIRSQYIEPTAPSAIDGITSDSNLERQVFSRTSNFQRTQLSARAFLIGLYPKQHEQIPTLVFNGTETDWIIRGYALCPKLAQRFKEFSSEDSEYKNKKEENEDFVFRLAQKLGYTDEDSTFENVFNVYDEYNIIRNDYDEEEYSDIEKLRKEDMNKLKNLADWYESRKFSFATHNVHVASGILAKILQHADNIKQASTDSYRIVHFSAHYPTLLTLLASLRGRNARDLDWPADEIPEFGAALIVEVHDEDGELWLRMKWFPGGEQNARADDVAIGVKGCTDASKKCKLSSMQRSLVFDTFQLEGFCRDCQSTSGVCAHMEESEVCSIGTKAASGAIGGALVIVSGVGLWLLHYVYAGKKKRVERAAMHSSDACGVEGEVYA